MGKFQDLTGQKFGRLTAIETVGKSKGGKYLWRCKCDCGNECIVKCDNLKNMHTQSCGCLQRERAMESSITHGLSDDKTYKIWKGIKARCFNTRHPRYKDWGGRGITLYEPWIHDFAAFYNYISQLEHFGEKDYTIDRIDNDGNYEPGNLRWATKAEQGRNKRNNILVEYDGEEMCLTEAAEKSGINFSALQFRYRVGDRGDRLFRPLEK